MNNAISIIGIVLIFSGILLSIYRKWINPLTSRGLLRLTDGRSVFKNSGDRYRPWVGIIFILIGFFMVLR